MVGLNVYGWILFGAAVASFILGFFHYRTTRSLRQRIIVIEAQARRDALAIEALARREVNLAARVAKLEMT